MWGKWVDEVNDSYLRDKDKYLRCLHGISPCNQFCD